jgi:L-histidine N-alpha-methyltransferase
VLSRREQQASVAAQVWDALSRTQRELPAHLLADPEIATLRRRVEQLDQPRLQEVESGLVRQSLAAGARVVATPRSLVELLPLPSASAGILEIARACAPTLPRPTFFACLGGSIGRFATVSAIRFLRSIRAAMTLHDRLFLGVDLRAARALEEDHLRERSLREEIHRRLLAVVNRDCGADFDPSRFRYYARYDTENKRLNVGLESAVASRVHIPGMKSIALPPGTTIRTGVQCTYDRRSLQGMLLGVGLIIDTWHEHDRGEHAVAAVSCVQNDASR